MGCLRQARVDEVEVDDWCPDDNRCGEQLIGSKEREILTHIEVVDVSCK
jgi:hypothetical protein